MPSPLRRIEARLSTSGSLAPLFFAFGLISSDELQKQDLFSATRLGSQEGDVGDTNFLHWLKEQVAEAVRTAEQHEMLKWHIRRIKSNVETAHQLAGLHVGAEYAASISEQERQVEVLKVLEQALAALRDQGLDFEGISMHLYHTSMCPQESSSFIDDCGLFSLHTRPMSAYIADDGCIHVVADQHTIQKEIKQLDLDRARTLTTAAYFWVRRSREVTPAVTELLRVRSVWCDTKDEQTAQKFVLWAGYLLEGRNQVESVLDGRRFSFSVIVHTDQQAPLISFHQSSPILNVSADCPPSHLLEFLASEAGGSASSVAQDVHKSRAREEAILESVRQALEAKCVIKICMNDKVIEGAQRLLDNVEVIKRTVDLKGACIALDDCYEVWDSGFISIPYNFSIQDLPSMVRMLQAGQRPGTVAGATDAAASATAARMGMEATGAAGGARTVAAACSRACSIGLATPQLLPSARQQTARPRHLHHRSRSALTSYSLTSQSPAAVRAVNPVSRQRTTMRCTASARILPRTLLL